MGSIVLVLASAYISKLQLELALCTVWGGLAVIPDALFVQVIQPFVLEAHFVMNNAIRGILKSNHIVNAGITNFVARANTFIVYWLKCINIITTTVNCFIGTRTLSRKLNYWNVVCWCILLHHMSLSYTVCMYYIDPFSEYKDLSS